MNAAAAPREITPDTVLDALASRVGPANGLTVHALASLILGAPADAAAERTLRQVIVKLRQDGVPVCATPADGYHMPSSAVDLQQTCVHLTQRAMTTLRQVAAMQRVALPDFYGQLGLPAPIGGSDGK